MISNKARIGVIGAGWWATYTHIPALQAHEDAELVALCDTEPAKLQAAAKAYGVHHTYTDLTHMLTSETLDGVIVATNHASHYTVAMESLSHGLHVLVEKPLTLYASEARDLVESARRQERHLIIGYPYHYTDHILRARDVIRSGVLGGVQFVNCTFTSHIFNLLRGQDGSEQGARVYPVHGPGAVYSRPSLSGGGEGHLQVTHSAGLMFFVTGLRAQRVHALMHNHGLPLDLVDVMAVEFGEGALGTVGGCGNLGGAGGGILNLQIFCANGSVQIDAIKGTTAIRVRDRDEEFLAAPDTEGGAYPRFATAHNLVDVCLGRGENGSPGEIGWRTVELLDAAYRSAQNGGDAVTIEELYL